MKKFHFRLEPLLRHRSLLEKQALAIFAHGQQSLVALRARATALQEIITRDAPVPHIRAHFQRIEWAMRMRLQTLAAISTGQTDLEPHRASLLRSMRDRRAVELLKERRFAAYRDAAEQAAERESEEIARYRISTPVL